MSTGVDFDTRRHSGEFFAEVNDPIFVNPLIDLLLRVNAGTEKCQDNAKGNSSSAIAGQHIPPSVDVRGLTLTR